MNNNRSLRRLLTLALLKPHPLTPPPLSSLFSSVIMNNNRSLRRSLTRLLLLPLILPPTSPPLPLPLPTLFFPPMLLTLTSIIDISAMNNNMSWCWPLTLPLPKPYLLTPPPLSSLLSSVIMNNNRSWRWSLTLPLLKPYLLPPPPLSSLFSSVIMNNNRSWRRSLPNCQQRNERPHPSVPATDPAPLPHQLRCTSQQRLQGLKRN